jgi:L-2,4-diaminobutyrate transaminase
MAETTHNLSLEEMDKQSLLHPSTSFADHAKGTPRIIETAKGVFIKDSKGTELMDGFGGLYCVNIGYGREEMAEAIYEQAKKLAYYHVYASHSNEPLIRLADRVVRMAPANMQKVYFGLSGSDANETNTKLLWYYNNLRGKPEKKKIISRLRGYHGSTVFSGSLTGLPLFHNHFNLPLGPVLHARTAHHYWGAEPGQSEREFSQQLAAELDAMIEKEGPDTVAGFIGEPVMGTGGILPPPEGYWQEIQKVCRKHDVSIIADEVVCGFGRLGSNFGCTHYDIEPDFMTIAKGLSSAYQPISGSIVSKRVCDVILEKSAEIGPLGHGYTYSGHPIGAAAANANLDIIEREDLQGNARRTGAHFQAKLHEVFDDHPLVGEARGVAMLGALEFVADKDGKERFDPTLKVGAKVSAACLKQGLIARAMPGGDILGFAPPLVMTTAEVDDMIARTKRAVDAVADDLVRSGDWKG